MSVQTSGESYVCHVAEAPKAYPQPQPPPPPRGGDGAASSADAYRFPTSNATGANRYATPRVETSGGPGDYPMEAPRGGDGAITAAVLLAAKTHAPAGHPGTVPHSKMASAAVADPFISEASMAGDEAATPGKPYSPTVGGGLVDRTSTVESSAWATEGVPHRLPAPLEDRVRGYSLMQPSSLAVSQRQVSDSAARHPLLHSTTLQGGWEENGWANEYPVERAPPPQQQQQQRQMLPPIARSAATGLPHDCATPEKASTAASSVDGAAVNAQRGRAAAGVSPADSGALVPTERPDASSVATYSHAEEDAAMKDLVSHVDRNSFGFDLRDALQSVDFAAVLQEYHSTAAVESKDLRDCRHLFRVVAKNKDAVSAEDVYDLLVLFTPCGAAFREGVDFLWENCEHKLSLSFENFLQYGGRLRARLRGYELFSQLSDTERILVTHHRVLPNVPLGEANEARLRLLQLADEQLEGAMRPGCRPLRLYEELFLVEYQEMLYEAALIPASEVPRRVAAGDFAHEQNRTLPRLSVPVLQKEGTDWRAGGGEAVYGDEDRYVVPYSGTNTAPGQVSPMHRDAHQGTGGMQLTTAQQPGRAGAMSQSKRNAASSRTANTCYGAYNPGGSRSGRNGESLAVSLQSHPRTETRKNLGRFVEEEYWERRTLDDHLITQLQTMYSNK